MAAHKVHRKFAVDQGVAAAACEIAIGEGRREIVDKPGRRLGAAGKMTFNIGTQIIGPGCREIDANTALKKLAAIYDQLVDETVTAHLGGLSLFESGSALDEIAEGNKIVIH